MRPSPPWFQRPERRVLAGLLGLIWSVLAGGCTTTAPPAPDAIEEVAAPPEPETPGVIPIIRTSRYTLVELAPTAAQQDLLLQVIEVSVPNTMHASVGDALRHVLHRSGFQLCDSPESDALEAFPLPAAHYQLGPILIRDALLTLVGPAWDLHVDTGARRVCFSRPVDNSAQQVAHPTPVPDAAVPNELPQGVQEDRP